MRRARLWHCLQIINGTQWGEASSPTSGYVQGVVSPNNAIFNNLGRQVQSFASNLFLVVVLGAMVVFVTINAVIVDNLGAPAAAALLASATCYGMMP